MLGYNETYEIFNYDSGDYVTLKILIAIERQGNTLITTIVAPGILVTVLGMTYILLPLGSEERLPFLSTIILTQVMFIVILASFVPLARDIPWIVYLFLELTLVMTGTTIINMVLQYLHRKQMHTLEQLQKVAARKDSVKFNDIRTQSVKKLNEDAKVHPLTDEKLPEKDKPKE